MKWKTAEEKKRIYGKVDFHTNMVFFDNDICSMSVNLDDLHGLMVFDNGILHCRYNNADQAGEHFLFLVSIARDLV